MPQPKSSLAQLSDAELDAAIKAQEGAPALRDMSDADLDKAIAAQSPKPDGGVDWNAARVGAEAGVMMGARPFVAGVGGGIGESIVEAQKGGPLTEMPGKMYEGFKRGFSEDRKDAQDLEAKLSSESPKSFYGGNIAGTLLMPGSAVKGVVGASKGLRAAAKVGTAMGVGQALGNADSVAGGIEDIGIGAALGPVAEIGVNAVGKGATAIARKLDMAAASNALRASGAMLKDYRAIEGKGGVAKVGADFLGRGLVKAGDTVESVAAKAGALKKDAGKAIESIYSHIKNQFGGADVPGFNPLAHKEQILNAAKEKLGDSVDGTAAIAKLSTYMDELGTKYGDRQLDIKMANDIKGHLDDAINYSRNPLNKQPEVEKAFHAAREYLSKHIDETVEMVGAKSGNPQILRDLKDANSAYGTAVQAEGMAKDKVRRGNANSVLGLRQSILAGSGGAAGFGGTLAAGGDIGDAMVNGATGAAAGLSLKTIGRYGPAIAAQAEQALAKQLNENSVLRRLVQKNPAMYQNLLHQAADNFVGPGGLKNVPIQRLTGETP